MKRTVALLLALTLTLSTTAAWSYFQLLSRAGAAMTEGAEKFLASLDDKQRSVALMEYEAPERVDWHFIPKDKRKGLQVRDMNEEQRKAAFELLKASLSETGYGKATTIMELEKLLAELQKGGKGGPLRDPERYYFTIFGKPSADGRWGLSVEGHHLSLNFVVEKGNVISSTPTVYATNPAVVMNEVVPSVKKGTRVLAKEETLAFDLLAALTDDQRKEAVIADKAPAEIRAAGEPQPPQEGPVGIAAEKLSGQQRSILQSLIDEYANNLPADVAKERLEAIEKQGLGKVYFAWAGADKPGIGHYYRVQGPTMLIEFVNVQPDAAGNPANHIHSIWRDMQGDFAVPIK